MKCKVLITVLMLSWMIMTSFAVYTQTNENDKGDKWWLMTEEEFNKWLKSRGEPSEEIKKVVETIEASKSQQEVLDLLLKYQDSLLCKSAACRWLFDNATEESLPTLKKVVQEELKVIEYIKKEKEKGNKELWNRFYRAGCEGPRIYFFPAQITYEYLRAKICREKFDQIKDAEQKFQEAVKMLTDGKTTLIKDDIETSSGAIRCIGLEYLLSIEDERVIPYLFWVLEADISLVNPYGRYENWRHLTNKILVEKYGKKAEEFALSKLTSTIEDFEKTGKWTLSGTISFIFLTENIGSEDALKAMVEVVKKYQNVKSSDEKAAPHRLLLRFWGYVTHFERKYYKDLKYDRATLLKYLSMLINIHTEDEFLLSSILDDIEHLKARELLHELKDRLIKEKSIDPDSSIVTKLERCINSIEKEDTNDDK